MHVSAEVLIGVALGMVLGMLLEALRRPRAAHATPGAGPPADHANELEHRVARLGEVERRILDRVLRREPVSRDTSAEFERQSSLGERMADRLAAFGGSWPFIGLFVAVLAAWIAYNRERPSGFDPYPFILLNLVLSCVAALQAPVILMSQNRMSARDRIEARHDYEVNLKAELEIVSLHAKIDELTAKLHQMGAQEAR